MREIFEEEARDDESFVVNGNNKYLHK